MLYFTDGRERIYNRTSHIHCPTLTKIGQNNCYVPLLRNCKFRHNKPKKGRTFLSGANGNTFKCVYTYTVQPYNIGQVKFFVECHWVPHLGSRSVNILFKLFAGSCPFTRYTPCSQSVGRLLRTRIPQQTYVKRKNNIFSTFPEAQIFLFLSLLRILWII